MLSEELICEEVCGLGMMGREETRREREREGKGRERKGNMVDLLGTGCERASKQANSEDGFVLCLVFGCWYDVGLCVLDRCDVCESVFVCCLCCQNHTKHKNKHKNKQEETRHKPTPNVFCVFCVLCCVLCVFCVSCEFSLGKSRRANVA